MSTRKLPDDEMWVPEACRHPEHEPPKHRVYEPGAYEHVCPKCGQRVVFRVPRGATL